MNDEDQNNKINDENQNDKNNFKKQRNNNFQRENKENSNKRRYPENQENDTRFDDLQGHKKFILQKLVRGRIPDILTQKGVVHDAKPLSRGRYLYKLKYKLIEEAKEILRTTNKNELIEELGDILEVFHLILKENNISMSDVLKAMQNKQDSNGIIQNIFVSIAAIPDSNTEMINEYEKKYKSL